MTKFVSYAHYKDPDGQRFQQYEIDPLPPWAVNVRPEPAVVIVSDNNDNEVIIINP